MADPIETPGTGGPGFNFPGANQVAGTNALPADKILSAQSNGMGIQFLQFPADLPKYQLAIIEADWENINMMRFTGGFKFPLPAPLHEQYTTQYDQNMNLLDAVGDLFPGKGGGTSLTGYLTGALGLHVNQYKAVTLKQPAFRHHTFSWKFAPKSRQEAFTLNSIVYKLKKGMQPKVHLNRTVFGFPKVYLMFFVPNIEFMYKFKPCVLQDLVVDYQGGNPAPAFYGDSADFGTETFRFDTPTVRQSASFAPTTNPPESLVVKTTWLELEYWADSSFPGNSQSANPFDSYTYYNNKDSQVNQTINDTGELFRALTTLNNNLLGR